ncbi:MAG: MBOAT family protein [Hyphomicrobiaceae bacterium]|nr:MBOAT family protein [Hyphomicrobiaceae bacterium]
MYFDAPIYFVFLPIVVLIYWQLSHGQQNRFLLCASYFFYGWWDWRFLSLILVSTFVDYHLARWIGATDDARRRRRLLVISLVMNLGFLGFFKYCNFFIDSFIDLLKVLGVDNPNRTVISVLLPPGISFYTFQAVAYIVDVYNRRLEPSSSLVDYALFISLFPHLIAGPIQRPGHLLPQVATPRRLDSDQVFDGLMLIATGLFRKCVIADNCALVADGVFSGRMGDPSLGLLLLGAYAFALQIYGDFSGYSDMARGSAKLLGFEFMVNFRQPYLATSLQDFWRRWHISLSTWLRDYLYIALGGNRGGRLETYRNLMLTMVIGGLWHGANWTFVVWGAIHGVGLAIERYAREALGLGPARSGPADAGGASLTSARAWIARILVFHVVCLAWVFFRAMTVGDAWHLLSGIGTITWQPELMVAAKVLMLFGAMMLAMDVVNETRREEYLLQHATLRDRFATALGFVCAVLLLSASNINAFIYFQF